MIHDVGAGRRLLSVDKRLPVPSFQLFNWQPGTGNWQPPFLLFWFQEALLEGEADELAAVMEAELLHDARAVGVHRLG
jgi:hypothetical protein